MWRSNLKVGWDFVGKAKKIEGTHAGEDVFRISLLEDEIIIGRIFVIGIIPWGYFV